MATSMQFGPEWMRKAPASKSGTGTTKESSTSPSAATSPSSGQLTPANGNSGSKPDYLNSAGAKRNGGISLGPAPVVSPAAASSPGGFSFAAAAAAATAQNERNGLYPSSNSAFAGNSDGDASGLLSNGALSKDKSSREKLLSLYSSDRLNRPPNAAELDAVDGPDRSYSRRKAGSERRTSGFSDFVAGSTGSGAPLSPNLGSSNEPRGLNARSLSGGSTGGFGTTGAFNWERSDRERPGLFQRGSNGASASATTAASTTTRPLSPSISRDRSSGIQGGVLSGVGPTPRSRMESSDGSRITRSNNDDSNGRVWTRSSNSMGSNPNHVYSDAFNSNRARTKTGQGLDSFSSSATESDGVSRPIVPSANPGGLSISARFARNKDRLPGEGPIGPPSDGSIGFGRSSGADRRRERQISQAKSLHQSQDSDSLKSPNSKTESGAAAPVPAVIDERDEPPTVSNRDEALQGTDYELAHHASSVFGSLKLDDEDSPNFHSARTGQHEVNNNHYDDQHVMKASQPSYNATPWSPESTLWLYRDMQGNVQGPFNGLMMQDWYSQRYFADDLLIKRQTDTEFWPLAQTVSAIGNALQPFLIPPSNWLHNLNTPTASFNNMQRGGSGANDHDRLGSDEPWSGRSSHQQWSAPLSGGGLNHSGANQAISSFGRGDPFASLGGFDSRLRTQEDLSALLRERELLEQRHGGARGLNQHDVFGSGLGGRSEWGPGAESGVPSNNWGLSHSSLGHFDSAGFGAHHSPRASERPSYDAFNQRAAFEQSGSPWTSRANPAPRVSTPLSHDAQNLGYGGGAPQQWAEQQYSQHHQQQQNLREFHHQQQQQDHLQQQQHQQVPWSYSQAAPDTPSRQPGELSDGGYRYDSIKTGAAPIGTPRRAQSPALNAESSTPEQSFQQKSDEQQRTFEDAFPDPVEPETREEPAQTSYDAKVTTPSRKSKKDAQQQQPATPVSAAAPTTPAPAARLPSPEQVVDTEPRPEELWPQSPTAVEFASEPDLSGMPEFTLSSKSKESKREQRSALQRQGQDAGRIAPGSGEQRSGASSNRQTGASNVRVVPQEQFKRGRDHEAAAASSQAPLSSWLQESSTTEVSSPSASKMAPWAARDDSITTTSAGPTLREIQEAEAKRAETKRAAEKAAARARMVTSPSANEDLPTSLSWGLASAPASKVSSSSTDQGTAGLNTPVWNAGKTTPKKTLMEIQEEEKKRADKVKAQQTAQAAAMRKAYADSASRSVSGSTHAIPSVNPGAGWSLVGSSGKPTVPTSGASSTTPASVTPAAVRPTLSAVPRVGSSSNVPTSMSTSGSGSAWSVVGAKAPVASNGAVTTPQPAPASSLPSLALRPRSYANDPNAPSPEFLKYLEENMKGLTIKAEDFIEMLLEFPLDPSPDMMEIIAESVYANSSTLDGRRFASDFVTKRKMDVQGRAPAAAKGWSATTRPSSDIKSQPGSRAVSGTVPAAIPGADAAGSGFKVVKKGAKKRS